MKTAIMSGVEKNKLPLGTTAYNEIYRRIITLSYEPGQRLEENHLVEELGIGRTPVREALQNLAGDLLVESQPKRGYIVRPITLQNTKSAFAALGILERGVAELAVRSDVPPFIEEMKRDNRKIETAVADMEVLRLVEINSSFHAHYASCSQNLYLIEGLRKIRCETNRLAYLSYGNEIEPERSLQDHYRSVIRQHDDIIRHLINRDEKQLKKTLTEHMQIFKSRIIHYLAS